MRPRNVENSEYNSNKSYWALCSDSAGWDSSEMSNLNEACNIKGMAREARPKEWQISKVLFLCCYFVL